MKKIVCAQEDKTTANAAPIMPKYVGKVIMPKIRVDNDIILPINTNLLFSRPKNLDI